MNKKCSICGAEKPLDAFDKDQRSRKQSRGGVGVASQCKRCRAERRKPGIMREREDKRILAARGLKTCGNCHATKAITEFHVRRASPDGLAYKCKDCVKSACVEWRKKNPDAFTQWSEENRERRSEYRRRWHEENKEARSTAYREWASKNPHIVNSLIAKRNAAKINATPAWADQDAIRSIYQQAAELSRRTGNRYEVDHIVPLQGKDVCGLHWEGNLQILSKVENLRKSNRLPNEDGTSRFGSDCCGHGAGDSEARRQVTG